MESRLNIDPCKFNAACQAIRQFCLSRKFVEMHAQNRLSIMAACEDPHNLATFNYAGSVWPLPQTSQMWLEYEILKNPTLAGIFSVSTSFRNEPRENERYDRIFPMFEIEFAGNMQDLIQFQKDLLLHLGFRYCSSRSDFFEIDYLDACEEFGVKELDHDHEAELCKRYGQVVFLKNFPEYTEPFWNMKRRDNGIAYKVDVIIAGNRISGMETIGSAQRSCNVEQMRTSFETISNGAYSKTLYSNFTTERVDKELNEYLNLTFFERVGMGIGMTRLIRIMDDCGMI
jgi:aspartyl/asparaginyl-tRNA synthetase